MALTKDVLTGISIGDKSFLRGDMTQLYSGVIILSDTIKTEDAPVGTVLPSLMKYPVKSGAEWDVEMQDAVCDFISGHFQNYVLKGKRILILSDKGDSRAPASIIRFLIRLGYQKKDAVAMVKAKTGFNPGEDIIKSFPALDENRIPVMAMRAFGKEKALSASAEILKRYGITDAELNQIPNISKDESDKVKGKAVYGI